MAWEHLPPDRLWALICNLPPGSGWQRHTGAPDPVAENLATAVDLLFHQLVVGHQTATFDPERWPEHQARALEAKRHPVQPPDVPAVQPVAIRPDPARSLTAALTAPAGNPGGEPVEEVEGHEAHARLQALLNP